MGLVHEQHAPEVLCDEARTLVGSCQPELVVELLAKAIESEAEDEYVQGWMCGEETIAFLSAVKKYVDAMYNRQMEKEKP